MAPAGGGWLRTVRFDMKTVHIISLFLAPLEAYTQTSMMAKAAATGAVRFNLIDLRDFGFGPHRKVDDSPYGGGDGLILMVEPLVRAIETARQETPGATTVLLTPRGQLFDQAVAGELAIGGDLILLGGYYSGYDERGGRLGRPAAVGWPLRFNQRGLAGFGRHRCRRPFVARCSGGSGERHYRQFRC